ncbi:hypothetical protein ABBQ38_014705 [Trebouxia sp. C0009 RCD-2024]
MPKDDLATVLKAAASLTVAGLGLWGGRYMMQEKEHQKSVESRMRSLQARVTTLQQALSAEVQEKVAAQGQAASLEGQLTTSQAASQQAAHDLEEAKQRIADVLHDLERIVELLAELRSRNMEANQLEDAHTLDVLVKEDLRNDVNNANDVSDRLASLFRQEAAAKTVAVNLGAQLHSQVEALQTRLAESVAAEVAARQEFRNYQNQVCGEAAQAAQLVAGLQQEAGALRARIRNANVCHFESVQAVAQQEALHKKRLAAAEDQAAALRADNGRLSLELTAACRGKAKLSRQLEDWHATGALFTEVQQQQEQEADALRARVRMANVRHFESVQAVAQQEALLKRRLAAAEDQAAALHADNGRLSLELTAACRWKALLSRQLEECHAMGGLSTEVQVAEFSTQPQDAVIGHQDVADNDELQEDGHGAQAEPLLEHEPSAQPPQLPTGQMGEPVDGNRGTNDALNSKGKHECKGDKADHILAVHPSQFELPEGESEIKPSAEPAPAPLADTHSASLTMEDMLEAAVQTTPEGQMSKDLSPVTKAPSTASAACQDAEAPRRTGLVNTDAARADASRARAAARGPDKPANQGSGPCTDHYMPLELCLERIKDLTKEKAQENSSVAFCHIGQQLNQPW